MRLKMTLCSGVCVRVVVVVVYVTTVGGVSHGANSLGPEHLLFKKLFLNYSAEARPVSNASHPVIVKFGISLNQLLDLDEKNQILTTSVWIYEDWKDENLVWKPKDYDGQRVLMIPASYLWLPDIFIFNIAGESIDGFVNVTGSKVSIYHNGQVRWMVPLIVNSACAVDVTYFPYDQQICEVKFGSWIYDLGQLDLRLTLDRPDLNHYVTNSEYDLMNVSLTRQVLDSSCCPGNGLHAMVNLKIHLSRKSLYYDYIVIAPTIMLCVLTLASFMLPCHKGEKIAIGLTVFLTLYVLQLRIADNVPDTNTTPILSVFLFMVMTFNCISLIMATIIMNIKKRGDEKQVPDVPSWILWLCHNVLSKIVCTRYLWKDNIPMPSYNNNNNDMDDTMTSQDIQSMANSDVGNMSPSNHLLLSAWSHATARLWRRNYKAGHQHVTEDKSQEHMFHMKRQWFFVAEVADKFAFLIYLVTMAFTILMILYVIPVYMRNDPVMT